MESIIETTQLIQSSKNIYIIPSESHEAIASALALFYTLKEAGKNVNALIDTIPERLHFLSPSLDFITYPKNFVISIPNSSAQVSQIYYEKNPDSLKVFLTIENGHLKKEDLSCYFSETKPDLVVTVGIQDYTKELGEKLNAFGFLLEAPILNIDNKQENKKFGKINIVEDKALVELLPIVGEKNTPASATAFLTSLVIYTENFQHHVTAHIFETASTMMKQGADMKEITRQLYQNPALPKHLSN